MQKYYTLKFCGKIVARRDFKTKKYIKIRPKKFRFETVLDQFSESTYRRSFF